MNTGISDAFNKAYEQLLAENDRLRKLKITVEQENRALQITISGLRTLLAQKDNQNDSSR